MYITTKMECFSFKSGHAMWIVELIKETSLYSVIVRISA